MAADRHVGGRRQADEALDVREMACLSAIRHVQLAVDVPEMELHRLLSDPQSPGNLAVGRARGNELQDLELLDP